MHKVLVVDDSAFTRRMMRQHLEASGFDVIEKLLVSKYHNSATTGGGCFYGSKTEKRSQAPLGPGPVGADECLGAIFQNIDAAAICKRQDVV